MKLKPTQDKILDTMNEIKEEIKKHNVIMGEIRQLVDNFLKEVEKIRSSTFTKI